jgi:predicted ATPase
VDGQIRNADVNMAYALVRKILRGDYVNETDGEKLYYSEKQWVKLMYASSGQQEVLWILLLIFIRILESRRVFLVVEEPEAHLFTSAQKEVLELIALLINSTGSQVVITTHSPYILTATNLLAYSGKVENNAKNLAEDVIIPRQTRVDPYTMQAYLISNQSGFSFKSIKDSTEQLIDPSYIDEVSTLINETTDRIMDLEIKYGMQ